MFYWYVPTLIDFLLIFQHIKQKSSKLILLIKNLLEHNYSEFFMDKSFIA